MSLADRRVINPILTNVARGYRNTSYVGFHLFPPVPVKTSGGKVITFGKEGMMLYNTQRAPGAATVRIDFGYSGDDYVLANHALEAKVPVEEAREAKEVPGIDLASSAIETAQDALLLRLEYDQAQLATDAARYGANNKLTLAGTDKWSDYANSDPIDDVNTARNAVRASCGVYPNVLTLGPTVYATLQNHPKLLERIKYGGSAVITAEIMAVIFGFKKVVVGEAVFANQAGEFADVWGNYAVLAYVPEQTNDRRKPSFGYTYTLQGHPFVKNPYYENNCESWIYGGTYERNPVIAGADAGFLISTPV